MRIGNIDVISNLMFSWEKPFVAIICLLWLCQIILGSASKWEKTHSLGDHKAAVQVFITKKETLRTLKC